MSPQKLCSGPNPKALFGTVSLPVRWGRRTSCCSSLGPIPVTGVITKSGRSGPVMRLRHRQAIPGKLWSEYCLSELLSIGPKMGALLSPCLDQLSSESHPQVCVLGVWSVQLSACEAIWRGLSAEKRQLAGRIFNC